MSVDPLDPWDPLDWLDPLVSLDARYEKTPQCTGCRVHLFAYFI